MRVVLPAPLGPMMARIFLDSARQGRFAQGEDAAERLCGIDDFKTIAHPFRPDPRERDARTRVRAAATFYRASDGGSNIRLTRHEAKAETAGFRSRSPSCPEPGPTIVPQSIVLPITYKAQARTQGFLRARSPGSAGFQPAAKLAKTAL